MKIKYLYWDEPDAINQIRFSLQRENIILATSDTVIGFLAPLTKYGFQQLNAIKGRFDKPYIVLISSIEKIGLFAEKPLNPAVRSLVNQCWPGPLTLIFKAKPDIPPFLQSSHGTIALRMPNHVSLLSVLKRFDGLFSTSANKIDQPIPHTIDEIDQTILNKIEYFVLDYPGQTGFITEPSTIVDCSGTIIRVVREGIYPVSEIKQIVKNIEE